MASQPTTEQVGPPPASADEQRWLADLTSTITTVTRITHSMRLYGAMADAAGLGVRPYLFGVLARIKELQPVRVSEVADEMDYDRSTVSRHVAELTALGCVARQPYESDGRVVMLELTPEGEEAVTKVFGAWMEFLRGATEDWSSAERIAFLALLTRFEQAIDASVAEL